MEPVATLPKDENPLSLLTAATTITTATITTAIAIDKRLYYLCRQKTRCTESEFRYEESKIKVWVKQSDLPSGINHTPGIELRRTNESKKI